CRPPASRPSRRCRTRPLSAVADRRGPVRGPRTTAWWATASPRAPPGPARSPPSPCGNLPGRRGEGSSPGPGDARSPQVRRGSPRMRARRLAIEAGALAQSRLPGRALRLWVQIAGVDRAMALAAQIFVAAIPAAAIVCVLVPGDGDYGDRLVTRLHLSGDAAHVVRQLFSSGSTGGQGLGAFGAVLLLLSILSL